VGRISAPAFIGDDTLLHSIGRIVRLRGLTVSACCGATIYPAPGAGRRTLARMAAMAVGASAPTFHSTGPLRITVPALRGPGPRVPAPRVPAPMPVATSSVATSPVATPAVAAPEPAVAAPVAEAAEEVAPRLTREEVASGDSLPLRPAA